MKAKPPVWLVCHICKAEYSVQPHRSIRSKCCSRQCAQTYAAYFAGAVQKQRRGTGVLPHTYVKEDGRHQHRVVAERKLGRELRSGEIVHHRDENPKNNHPDNLEILPSQSDHMKVHLPAMRLARKRKVGY